MSDRTRLLTNVALIAAWLLLFRPVVGWLGVIFSRSDFRLNQVLLVGALALLAHQVRTGGLRPSLFAPLRPRRTAAALVVVGAGAFLFTERYLDINILSGVWFGASAYGLAGLWMDPRRWRQGLPVAALMVATLPFDTHLQVFLGYPLRVLTARLVADGLGAFGWNAGTADTILVLESRFAQVDLPCSGVRSLWSGGVFLLAASWIERRPIGLRWAGVAALASMLLVGANVFRVAALVVVGQVYQWPMAAEVMHVPLGLLGFGFVCGASVWLLRRIPPMPDDRWTGEPAAAREAGEPAAAREAGAPEPRLAAGLIGLFVAMSLLHADRPETGLRSPPADWSFAEVATQAVPLTPAEIDWLRRDGADAVSRVAFQRGALEGSMILITSRTWRAHHLPERCFEVFGLEVTDTGVQMTEPAFPIRVVTLGQDERTAAYWFQAATGITDDYASRIWSDLEGRQTWVLVSMLFDRAVDPTDPAVRDLFIVVRDAVTAHLTANQPDGGRS